MARIPKKVLERLSKEVTKFQRVLQEAKDRDINEADTVSIIKDILSNVFGFDKYTEVTSEFAIRGTYCDLATKINGNIQYLIEVKAIGLDLRESHLRQSILYGAQQGIKWVVLANGIVWQIYRIKFEQPLQAELVYSINFLELNPRKVEDQEKLFLLCKEGLGKAAIEEFHEYIKSVNRFVIGALILSEPLIDMIRKQLKRITPGLKVSSSEIEGILRNEVIKRDVIEGETASIASKRIKKISGKALKKRKAVKEEEIFLTPRSDFRSPESEENN